MRMFRFLKIMAFSVLGFASAPNAADDRESVICDEYDGVVELPGPFDNWIEVLCTPDGQAIAPDFSDEGVIWLIHETKRPFLLKALPEDAKDRLQIIETVGDQVRFVSAIGGRLRGNKEEKARQMFEVAFSNIVDSEVHEIWQLDIQSAYAGRKFNLFFYTLDNYPLHILFCQNRCNKSVSVDVKKLSKIY